MRALRTAAACAAAALVCAAPAAAHTDGPWPMHFDWPAQGTETRGFGYDPTMGENHQGIDIGSLRSLDVTAAAPGTVEKVGYQPGFDGYGEIVLVNVGQGYETLYAHLAQPLVKAGDVVWAGEKIAEAGDTGHSTGTHLHFEVREDGTAVDPAPLLPALPATLLTPQGG